MHSNTITLLHFWYVNGREKLSEISDNFRGVGQSPAGEPAASRPRVQGC